MLKIITKRLLNAPNTTHICTDDYIPFTLNIGDIYIIPETIYIRNYFDGNLMEFRFDKFSKQIYEITLLSIQKKTLVYSEKLKYDLSENQFHNCLINIEEGLKISEPMTMYYNENNVKIDWSKSSNCEVSNFLISEKCAIGLDSNDCLVSVYLINLDKDEIINMIDHSV